MNVAQSGRQLRCRTDKDVAFTAGLAQDHGIQYTLPANAGGGGSSNGYSSTLGAGKLKALLRSIKILSKENLAWELWFFGSSSFATTDAGLIVREA